MDKMTLLDEAVPHLYVRQRKKSATYVWRSRRGDGAKIVLGRVGQIDARAVKRIAKDMNLRQSLGLPPVAAPESEPDIPTFGEVFDRLTSERRDQDYVNIHRQHFHSAGFINKRVDQITINSVEAFISRIAEDRPVQANRLLVSLRSVFKQSIKRGWIKIENDPTADIKKRPEKKRERYLTADQWQALYHELIVERQRCPEVSILIMLCALTGARVGELRSTRWSDVEFTDAGGVITLWRHKTDRTGKPRRIYLSREAALLIKQVPQGDDQDTVFADGLYYKAVWARVKKRAGLVDFHLHDLRHNFATRLLAHGKGLDQVGMILGHTDSQTTRRYAHLLDDTAFEAVEDISYELMQVPSNG